MIEKNEGWKRQLIRLRELRKEHGFTLKNVADALNTSNQVISRYELGQTEPDFATLIRIAEFFNVSVDYLLGHTDKRQLSGSSLTEKESRLLGAFKGLIPPMQDYVLEMVEKLVEKDIGKNKKLY